MKIPKKGLDIFKEFMEQEYYHTDFNTQGLIILHPIKSFIDLLRSNTNFSDDVQIIYNINVYKDVRFSDLDRIVAKYFNF